MGDPLRFGLIGSGSQGRYLSEALAMTGQASLVACADPSPEARAAAARECGWGAAYSDYRELLAQAPVDAVIVATVHDQLQPAARAAVQAGKHLFVEKPMALNAADGEALVQAARAAGRRLMVGFTLRFMPERILMKRLLDVGAIGEVVHVVAGQLIGAIGGWLGDPAHGGGPLLYIGTHVLDQVLWVVDRRAERVHAEVEWADSGVDAGAAVTIRFAGGVTAQVLSSQRMGGRYGWLDLIGTAGRLRVEWESGELYIESGTMDAYRHPTRIEVPRTAYLPAPGPDARPRLSGVSYVRNWMAEMTEFIAAIREDRDPTVTGEDAVRVLRITDAVFASARSGAPVAL
jgi:predicted dehydrogenase